MPVQGYSTVRSGGRVGKVQSWASIIDANALEQAQMISRGPVTHGHVAVMPDAHLGIGACVGTAIVTAGGIYPAAVGVDIGCGMVAERFAIKASQLDIHQRRRLRNAIAKAVPSGVGVDHPEATARWQVFARDYGMAPSIRSGKIASGRVDLALVAARQFGTLGAGNHFVELSEDEDDALWAIVHSGSRGIGNAIARHHISVAQRECIDEPLENRDLSYLRAGTPSFSDYLDDMRWAQHYAWHQRLAMLAAVRQTLQDEGLPPESTDRVHCHHNYSEPTEAGWLSRKGAVDARLGVRAILPGSMGTDTYIVQGLGNEDSYNTAPHGAGRVSSRGRPAKGTKKATGAYARFTVEEFQERMEKRGVVWQDRDAHNLLDESPMVYKPIEVVLADSADLIRPLHRLQQIVNYKGV